MPYQAIIGACPDIPLEIITYIPTARP